MQDQAKTESQADACDEALQALEQRVEHLVKTLSQLRQENKVLRHQQSGLARDKASLFDQNQQVRARLEALAVKLKTLE